MYFLSFFNSLYVNAACLVVAFIASYTAVQRFSNRFEYPESETRKFHFQKNTIGTLVFIGFYLSFGILLGLLLF